MRVCFCVSFSEEGEKKRRRKKATKYQITRILEEKKIIKKIRKSNLPKDVGGGREKGDGDEGKEERRKKQLVLLMLLLMLPLQLSPSSCTEERC